MPRSSSNTAQPGGVEVGVGWRHSHYAHMLEQLPDLDFLEVHSENFFGQGGAALALLEQARAHYPISLHGVGLSLGSVAGIDARHLEQLDCLVQRVEPVRVSDHASFARGAFQGQPLHASDLLPLPFSFDSLNVLCDNVERVQDRLQRRFMVENLSAYITWKAPVGEVALAETEFLTTLARRTGCLLLVDVNNIYVNALNASREGNWVDPEVACRSWLDAMDPQTVGEIHLAGHCRVSDAHGDIVIDDHGSLVCEAVWRLYQHAMQRFGPVPTLMEWDTNLPALEVLLDEAARARRVAVRCPEWEVA